MAKRYGWGGIEMVEETIGEQCNIHCVNREFCEEIDQLKPDLSEKAATAARKKAIRVYKKNLKREADELISEVVRLDTMRRMRSEKE